MPSSTGIFSGFEDAKRAAMNITKTLGISMDQMNLLTPGADEAELAAVPTTDAEQPGSVRLSEACWAVLWLQPEECIWGLRLPA
jgi:hypothetical protein